MKDPRKPVHPILKGTLRLVAFGAAFAMIMMAQQLPAQDAAAVEVPPAPEKPQPMESKTVDLAGDDGSTTTVVDGNWSIRITPKASSKSSLNEETLQKVADYNEIYESIPYRRAEYLANPSYRHDTAVEILFGEMRDTVIHRQDTPQRVQNPRPQIYRPDAFPYIGDYRKFYWRQGLYSLRYFPSPIYPTLR